MQLQADKTFPTCWAESVETPLCPVLKGRIGWSWSERRESIWIPTCFFEGANVIFTHLERLNCYSCSKPPSLAGLAKCRDLLEQHQQGSPPPRTLPSLRKEAGPLAWSKCSSDGVPGTPAQAQAHTHHTTPFSACFLRLGTKLRSEISPGAHLLF